MKFLITMNMPARSGVPIHQITCEHPAASVDAFAKALSENDFIVVEELYRDANPAPNAEAHYSVGRIVINPFYIGKVKAFGTTTHSGKAYYEN